MRVELAQHFVCSELNVACEFDNTAAYLASWLEALKCDRKEVFRAAADAQRIADYLLGFHPAYRNQGGPAEDEREPTPEPMLAEAA